MKFDDKLYVQHVTEGGYDEDLNPIEPTVDWVEFGKCIIMPNESAVKTTLADGSEYIYKFEIIATLKKAHYANGLIPKEGQTVRFVKKDGTIDKTETVQGFLTLKQRYLKVWI